MFSDVGTDMSQLDSKISLFLDTFAKQLLKITVSFAMFVHLSAWKSSSPTGWSFVQIAFEVFCGHFDD
jgi:hypothetical protein